MKAVPFGRSGYWILRPPDPGDFKVIPFSIFEVSFPPAAEAGRFMNRPYKSRYPLRFIGDGFSVGGNGLVGANFLGPELAFDGCWVAVGTVENVFSVYDGQ